jgi:predicted phosphodiesterase
MKIAILSDMHLQENMRASNFKHSDDQLLSLFKYLDRTYEEIYLVGDIFECQQTLLYPSKNQQQIVLNKTITTYRKSFDYAAANALKFKYLSGNHDSIMHEGDKEKLPYQLTKIYKGREITLVTEKGTIDIRHGEERHQYDSWIKYILWLGTWLGGLLERLTNKNIPMRTGKPSTFPNNSFETLCGGNSNILLGIRGHNHVSETYGILINDFKRTYVNAGFSNKNVINIAEVNTKTLKANVLSYKIEEFKNL